MAERKLTKSELTMKKNNPKRFAELQKMRAKRGKGYATPKTIRDAGQGKGKAAKTAMEKRADQAGKKATRQALQKGASPAKAKQVGKKAARAIVSGSNVRTAVELGKAAVGFLPFNKVAKGVKGLRSLIKGGSKSKTPPKSTVKKTPEKPTTTTKQRVEEATKGTPSKSNTPFRLRKGNENKSQKALESGKAIPKTPSVRLKPTKGGSKSKTTESSTKTSSKLTPKQRAAITATTAVPVVLGANALLKNKPKVAKKPKPKPEAVKKPKPDLSYRPDEGSPAGTVSKKSTKTYTPRKKYEGGIDSYETPFGTIKADSSDDAFNFDVEEKDGGYLKKDMMMKKRKKGGVVKRRMGGKVGGYGKALRGY